MLVPFSCINPWIKVKKGILNKSRGNHLLRWRRYLVEELFVG